MFLEITEKVFRVTLAIIFGTKVVDGEDKLNPVPLVTPETRSGGGLVLVVFFKAFAEEIFSKFYRLREAVDTLAYFEVNPTCGLPN